MTPDTEEAWVARARGLSARVLEREVAGALVGDVAPSGDPEPGPCRVRLVFELDSADAQLVRDGIVRMRAEVSLNREEVGDGALLAAIVRRGLEAESGPDVPTAEAWRVVIDTCPSCRQSLVGDAEVSEAVAGEAACDAERVDLRPGPGQGQITRTVPPATRRAVLHRHRGRCAVPGCVNRMWLHIHHLRGRASGGGHERDNLVAICPSHHRAVHEGVIGIERTAEGDVVVRRQGCVTHVGRDPGINGAMPPSDFNQHPRLGAVARQMRANFGPS